ncbi:MAG TPA: hypothetical protein VG796_00395 [Verrucomicrobiales bacterium]|nr:hypothetical protein [Verrucomicrobiales bacterium]
MITPAEFFSRWDGKDRLFHHNAPLTGRKDLLERIVTFGAGGRGTKVLILSAAGGIGKTRLLRAAAEHIEKEAPERIVRFINPAASPNSEPPRDEDAGTMTVFHDDAHRIDTIPLLIPAILSAERSNGSRFILATRPGAEEVLRELLMRQGYQARDIEQQKVDKLSRPEMEELAAYSLGPKRQAAAHPLASLSEGCALITLVGAELLQRGEINDLDLTRSDEFRAEVFHRFEGQELERIRGHLQLDIKKLLRCIALLSPWDSRAPENAEKMAEFLGVQRGQVDEACDSLLTGGLLLLTRDGFRITPDLFSDHLVYAACYDENGQNTQFTGPFLDRFLEKHSRAILKNLAEAEWRAFKKHGKKAVSLVTPVWNHFLKEFQEATFWERSRQLEQWSGIAFFQPERSLELAQWAMALKTAPPMPHVSNFDNHSTVLGNVPALLKPVAIWSHPHRRAALDLLWRLHIEFPRPEKNPRDSEFRIFAEIASFRHNYPLACEGVLEWLEEFLTRPDAAQVVDKPSDFLETILRPYSVRCVEQNFWKDKRTFVFSNVPISVSKTKAVRQRAFRIVTVQVIPRGTVAAINALPALGDFFHQPAWNCELNPATSSAWLPEQREALLAIRNTAECYPHPLVHHHIRRMLRWQVVYGNHPEFKDTCREILLSLPDTFEMRLARLTLSWCHEDSLEPHDPANRTEEREREKVAWDLLIRATVAELLKRYPSAAGIHFLLSQWHGDCTTHCLSPRMTPLLIELATQDQPLAFSLLCCIHETQGSPLAYDAAALLGNTPDGDTETWDRAVQCGLESGNAAIACSFLSAIQFRRDLRTNTVRDAVLRLTATAEGTVLNALISLVRYASKSFLWASDITLAILRRDITDQEADSLANAVYHGARYGDIVLDISIVSALLDRLAKSNYISSEYHEHGFLHFVTPLYPRLVFDTFLHRVERSVRERAAGNKEFDALPVTPDLSMQGIENDPEFEEIARDLLQRVRDSNSDDRWLWEKLFAMTVTMTSPLVETLLLERIPAATDTDTLLQLAELTGFEHSLVIFRYPQLTEAFLRKATEFGHESLERITSELIHGAGSQSRGYTNGELDPEYRYLREEAEKAVKEYEADPMLGPFYQEVLEREIRDADWNRKRMAEDDGEEW